jgi:hypothetical protein
VAITDVLRSAQGGAAIGNLAKAYGISPAEAQAVVEAVIPKLSETLERNTLSRGGLADLVNALGHGHHEAYVDDPRMISNPEAREDGNAILGHILGTKDKSRAIADKASATSGVSSDIIKSMLPVIAGMMMGGLSKQVKSSFGDILGRVGSVPPAGSGRGGVFLPKQPLPRGAPPPDADQPTDMQTGGTGGWGQDNRDDGNVRSKPGGGLELPGNIPDYSDPGRGQSGQGRSGGGPLPIPGNRVPGMPGNGENPYGDLAEILRRGLGLPGGSGGPIIIPLPGGGSFPFPFPGGEQGGGQSRGQQRAPMPEAGGGGGFPWPQGGGQQGGGGLPMPGGNGGGGGFPWPQGGGQTGGQGSPLPMPGGGGGRIELPGGQVGGGMLWNIIRTILGSALGFQSKGMMSWLIRMVVMKYGWTILRTILGRGMMGGR